MTLEQRIEAVASELAIRDRYNPNAHDHSEWAAICESYCRAAESLLRVAGLDALLAERDQLRAERDEAYRLLASALPELLFGVEATPSLQALADRLSGALARERAEKRGGE